MQDVVNGMFREGRPIVEEPVLGVVAANAGCDLPLSFGLPRDIEGAVGHLAGADTYPFDVMKIAVTGPRAANERSATRTTWRRSGSTRRRRSRPARPGRTANLRRFLGFWRAYVRTSVADR